MLATTPRKHCNKVFTGVHCTNITEDETQWPRERNFPNIEPYLSATTVLEFIFIVKVALKDSAMRWHAWKQIKIRSVFPVDQSAAFWNSMHDTYVRGLWFTSSQQKMLTWATNCICISCQQFSVTSAPKTKNIRFFVNLNSWYGISLNVQLCIACLPTSYTWRKISTTVCQQRHNTARRTLSPRSEPRKVVDARVFTTPGRAFAFIRGAAKCGELVEEKAFPFVSVCAVSQSSLETRYACMIGWC